MPHPFFDLPVPLAIGHRGAAGEAPENTLHSFARAREAGAQVLESDVHAARDGAVVIFHDDTLERTSDGEGPIANQTLEELRRLDAGHRFSPDGGRSFPFRGRGHRIPTLEEAFDAFPDARFNLELKEFQPELVSGVVDLVRRFDRADRTLLTAADDSLMCALRRCVAETSLPVATGACAGEVAAFVRSTLAGGAAPDGVMALQVPGRFRGQPLVTPAFVENAHAAGIQVHVWTVNEVDEMHRLLELGVDGLISDFPGRLVDVIASRRGHD